MCTFSENTSPQIKTGPKRQALAPASLSSNKIEPYHLKDPLLLVARDRPLASPEARCLISEEPKKKALSISRDGRRYPPFKVPPIIHLYHDDNSQVDPQESESRDQRGATSDNPLPIDNDEPLYRLKLEVGPHRHGLQSCKRSIANLNQGKWY